MLYENYHTPWLDGELRNLRDASGISLIVVETASYPGFHRGHKERFGRTLG